MMKRYGRHTLLGWTWRTLMWIALSPLLILAVLSILIYIPPVQKWAVDKASAMLSEEMQMEVSVDKVLLKCPLDLSLNGVLTRKDGTVALQAEEMALSVRFLPLFSGNVEVDDVHLNDVHLNTLDLVEACHVEGNVGHLTLVSHSTSLTDEVAVINHAKLADAELNIVMADSVPEDTTVSEPVTWKVDLRDVAVENVHVNMTLALPYEASGVASDTIDSIQHVPVSAYIGTGKTKAYLDLYEEVYDVNYLDLKNSSVSYGCMVDVSNVSARVDSLSYHGTGDMALALNRFVADVHPTIEGVSPTYNLHIAEAKGRVEMDSLTLRIPHFLASTDDSKVQMKMSMDLNAFDSIAPGKLSVEALAHIGHGEIQSAINGFMPEKDAREMNAMLNQYLPSKPIQMALKADGNMQVLNVEKFNASIDGFAHLVSSALLDHDRLSAKAVLDAYGGKMTMTGNYSMANEAYNAKLGIQHLVANRIVPLEQKCTISGNATVEGKGFDILSHDTWVKAKAKLTDARYGKLNLSTSQLDASLRRGIIDVDYDCNNSQLRTTAALDANIGNVIASTMGKAVRESITGNLDIDLPYADIEAMGFIDTVMVVSTSGTVDFSAAKWSSLRPAFLVDTHVNSIHIKTYADSINTNDFKLRAMSTSDSTSVFFHTGDMNVDFHSPNNVMAIAEQAERFSKALDKQLAKREVNLEHLKQYIPKLDIDAFAGVNNPIIRILDAYGMRFREFALDAETSPEFGIKGNGHMYALRYDTIRIDTAFFDIRQDSTLITYRTGLSCDDQPMIPGFRALLDGYLDTRDADAHLRFYNKKNETGIDLGAHVTTADTAFNISLYPAEPVIGYERFRLNSDNYIQVQRTDHKPDFETKPVLADVRLEALRDSTTLSVFACGAGEKMQFAQANIQNLNMARILSVIPYMPSMSGIIDFDIVYTGTPKDMDIEGEMALRNYAFEGKRVGNLHSKFNYVPEGFEVHTIKGTLDYNDVEVADIVGKYSAIGDGYLDADLNLKSMPMSIASPFVPDQLAYFTGNLFGSLCIQGPVDKLVYNGAFYTDDVHIKSDPYSLDLSIVNDTVKIDDSRLKFDNFKIYGAGSEPVRLKGYYDFADLDNMYMSLSFIGYNFKLIEAKRTAKSVLFGDVYGDFVTRVNGPLDDLSIRGMINVLSKTNMTYVMTDATIYQGDRLEDIVTFVDFNAPPDTTAVKPKPLGIDMDVTLNVEDGAKFVCEFSADKQSYVNVRGGGSMSMMYTPEGILSVLGRLTINEGEMKYTLPVIPLKTFNIASGSYIEFNGDVMNPTMNIAATERTKASVSDEGQTARSVTFDVGLKITNTLSNMGLQFTIEAPTDAMVQNELASMSDEDKNKLAVALLATGMYVSDRNASAITANSALNNFLQSEINNITGKALNSIVDVSLGIDETTYSNGNTGTDYSFKFSKRFFSDRLSVVIGGRVSSNNEVNRSQDVNSFIDDVSLEWRLDNSATRYVRLFHTKDYENVMDGELEKNGVGLVLRKKVDKITELFVFKKSKK